MKKKFFKFMSLMATTAMLFTSFDLSNFIARAEENQNLSDEEIVMENEDSEGLGVENVPEYDYKYPSVFRIKIKAPVTDANNKTITYSCINYGMYWQNDTNADGKVNRDDDKEPIKWRILETYDTDNDSATDKVLMISDKVLDAQIYNSSYFTNNDYNWWGYSKLREFLNEKKGDTLLPGDDYFYKNIQTKSGTDGKYSKESFYDYLNPLDIGGKTYFGFNGDNIGILSNQAYYSWKTNFLVNLTDNEEELINYFKAEYTPYALANVSDKDVDADNNPLVDFNTKYGAWLAGIENADYPYFFDKNGDFKCNYLNETEFYKNNILGKKIGVRPVICLDIEWSEDRSDDIPWSFAGTVTDGPDGTTVEEYVYETGVSLGKESIELRVGDTYEFDATVFPLSPKPTGNAKLVSYKSDNDDAISFVAHPLISNKCTVTAKAPGTAVLTTQTFNCNYEDTCTIIVKDNTKHEIKINETKNGKVTASPASAMVDEVVKLEITADEGYALDKLSVANDADNKALDIKDNTFLMPNSNVTVNATFISIKNPGNDPAPAPGPDPDSAPDPVLPDISKYVLTSQSLELSNTLFDEELKKYENETGVKFKYVIGSEDMSKSDIKNMKKVGTVNKKGIFKAKNKGNVKISLQKKSKSDTSYVTVSSNELKVVKPEFKVNNNKKHIATFASQIVSANELLVFSDGNDILDTKVADELLKAKNVKLEWSAKGKVASIDSNGNITINKSGKCTVKVTLTDSDSKKIKASFNLWVKIPKFNKKTIGLKPGKTAKYSLKKTVPGINEVVSVKAENEEIVTVDMSASEVTASSVANKGDRTKLIATTTDGKTYSCDVIIK